MSIAQLFTLGEFIKARWPTLQYFFEPKVTINYQYKENRISLRARSERGSTALRAVLA
ncbi:MAG: hypothetical protein V4574_12645 [Pseudomonadota bacterium]